MYSIRLLVPLFLLFFVLLSFLFCLGILGVHGSLILFLFYVVWLHLLVILVRSHLLVLKML